MLGFYDSLVEKFNCQITFVSDSCFSFYILPPCFNNTLSENQCGFRNSCSDQYRLKDRTHIAFRTHYVTITFGVGGLLLITFCCSEILSNFKVHKFSFFSLNLFNYRWKRIIQFSQKLLKIYEINIKFKLWARIPRPPNLCPTTVYMCR